MAYILGEQVQVREPAQGPLDPGTEQDSGFRAGKAFPGRLHSHVVEKEDLGDTCLAWNPALELVAK